MLNECRCQLYMASIMLTKNAMGRLAMEWKDPLNMEKTFGESVMMVAVLPTFE
jgi:hypothetical protein